LYQLLEKFTVKELLLLIIIDSGLTVHLFQNPDLFSNRKKVNKNLKLKTNGGTVKINEVGEAKLDTLWFSELVIGNDYSHSLLVKNGCRIVSDIMHNSAFCLHKIDRN